MTYDVIVFDNLDRVGAYDVELAVPPMPGDQINTVRFGMAFVTRRVIGHTTVTLYVNREGR